MSLNPTQARFTGTQYIKIPRILLSISVKYIEVILYIAMNMLVTSQFQPMLSSITIFFPRWISQSDCSIHIKLNIFVIAILT